MIILVLFFLKMNKVYLLLGTSMGVKVHNLYTALGRVSEMAGRVLRKSAIYKTQPWGFVSNEYFLNQAVLIETWLSPANLLEVIKSIEKNMGRIKTKAIYESRVIDIDILFYNSLVIEQNNLVIPHPRMHERRFALVPLADITAGFLHPLLSKTIHQLLLSCADTSEVTLL